MPDAKTPTANEDNKVDDTQGVDQTPVFKSGMTEAKLKKPLLEFGKKSVTGKIIATIFSLLLLLAGIAAGVLLIQQQQEIRERAGGGEECVASALCTLLDEPENTFTYEAASEISHILITGRDVYRYEQGVSDDGCYRVTMSKNIVMWSKYGTGDNCKDIVNVQVWKKQ